MNLFVEAGRTVLEPSDKQAFIVEGRRTLSRKEVFAAPSNKLLQVQDELQKTLEAWLWISPVVVAWRTPPELIFATLYHRDVEVVKIRGRGWLDLPDSGFPWVIDLP